ncbi:hypothetical protein [Marinitenerispora sediminis]|nr:hypothetical protein [Marinitenerispora sediminis]
MLPHHPDRDVLGELVGALLDLGPGTAAQFGEFDRPAAIRP